MTEIAALKADIEKRRAELDKRGGELDKRGAELEKRAGVGEAAMSMLAASMNQLAADKHLLTADINRLTELEKSGAQKRMNINDFKGLCGVTEMPTKEVMALFSNAGARAAMESGSMTSALAKRYLAQIRERVQTSTKVAIAHREDLILDGDIMAQGQAKSSLHFAFRGVRVVCAKVYNHSCQSQEHSVKAAEVAAHTEAEVSDAVHAVFICPTLIQVEQLIETRGHAILVLPLLGRACSDLPEFSHTAPMLDSYAGAICMSILSAIAGLAMLGWCHGDVKPGNVMLPTHKHGHVTLIDLASCMRYGEDLVELTAGYSMELQPRQASLKWDLVCTAATLYALSGTPPARSWEQLRDELSSAQLCEADPLSRQLCHTILCNVDSAVEELEARVWQPCLKLVEVKLGKEVAGALQGTWPQRRSDGE